MAVSVSTSASFQQTTLDNGLRVILREVRERPLVGVWMWYRVGGRNELPGTTGVSHWVEHMLFKGGKRFGKGEITKEISRRGGALNAFTWIDCTAYFETLPADEIDIALAIESDRIYDTRIEPDEAEAERTVVISEREGSENYPEFWLREEVQAVAWREHPYRLGVIGPKSDLRAMTRENLYDHYKRYYMTNNATLVMVGDFSSPRVLDRIHAEFDKHPAGPTPPKLQIEEQPQTGERRVQVSRPGPTHYVMLAYHAPQASHLDAAAMVVLSSLLGGASSPIAWGGARGLGRSSRLYRALIDGEIASSVSAGYELTVDPYLFAIDATLRTGVEPARAVTRRLESRDCWRAWDCRPHRSHAASGHPEHWQVGVSRRARRHGCWPVSRRRLRAGGRVDQVSQWRFSQGDGDPGRATAPPNVSSRRAGATQRPAAD